MKTITAFGTIKDGVLTIQNKTRLKTDLTGQKDCAVEITIKKRNRRSLPQNGYLWGVVYKEVEVRLRELGNDVDINDVHEYCKFQFNAEYLVGKHGEAIGEIGSSTADLNRDQFGVYIDRIVQWAAEVLGIYIPAPNADLQFNF